MESPKLIDLTSKREIPINSDEYFIGRGMRNSFIIEDLQVSRTHCIIEKAQNTWRIIDKSVNGTKINDKALPKNWPVDLTHGDVIGISENTKFMFSIKIPPEKEQSNNVVITEAEIADIAEMLITEIDSEEGFNEPVVTKSADNKSEIEAASATKSDNNLETAENEFQCSICTELFIKAVTLNCSHTFCNFCISEWRKRQSICPICRTKITTAFPTLVLDNFIEKMLESASEEVKAKRQEALALRDHSEQPKNDGKKQAACSEVRSETGTIELSSDDEDSFEDDEMSAYSGSDYDNDSWYEGYNGRPGAYYGGYGYCYNCGDAGHWSNGCPRR